MTRKRRTRQHVIADLSTNFMEWKILLESHTAQRIDRDYGYDLQMYTYDENGESENGLIYIQLKATDSLEYIDDGLKISLALETKDIEMWYNEIYPVYVILYDPIHQEAYWLDIKNYLSARDLSAKSLVRDQKTLHVHFEIKNRVDKAAIQLFREKKNRIHSFLYNLSEKEGL